MTASMSSRERLLAAFAGEAPDRVPLAFMLFTALRERLGQGGRSAAPQAVIQAQLDLGLEAVVDLSTFVAQSGDAPGLPIRFGPGVHTRQWAVTARGARYPVLHKEYTTPAGTLHVAVNQTDDWPYGSAAGGDFEVPFLDDYLEPRSLCYLVQQPADVEALTHLLAPPTTEDLTACRRAWQEGRRLAQSHDLLVAGGWGVGGDALAWLCGLERAVFMALDAPEFLAQLLAVIEAWNRPRMEAFLEFGVDLFVRRAWYEGTDFWSPALFRRFFYPVIAREVRLAHQAGAKYGYILTSGSAPLHAMLVELGIDVLIGPDPVQGKGTDLRRMRADLGGRVATWGGVNGFVTVERGSRGQIDAAVRAALEALGPDGFVLSPVDNVRDPSDEVWQRVEWLIDAWRRYR